MNEYKIEAVKSLIDRMENNERININIENLPNKITIHTIDCYAFEDFHYALSYKNIDDFINNIEKDLNQVKDYFKSDFVNELFRYQSTKGDLDLLHARSIVKELDRIYDNLNKVCDNFKDFSSRCNGPELEYNPETVEVGLSFGSETLDECGYVCMEASLYYNDWAGEEHIIDFNIRYDFDENHYDCIIENEEKDNDLFESMFDNDILPYEIDIAMINNKAEILNNLKSSSLEDKLAAAEQKAASHNQGMENRTKDDLSL